MAGLSLACASGSQGDVRPLVPAVDPNGSSDYRPGSFIWFDLVLEDTAEVQSFYRKLLGWSFRDSDRSGRYLSILRDGRVIGGVAVSGEQDTTDHRAFWLSSVSVPDVDRTSTEAAASGASVILEPAELPNRGRYSVIEDPQGAPLVLLRSSSGDGEVRAPGDREPGEWLWMELWTRDLESASQFYSDVFGYGFEYRDTRSADERPIAGGGAEAGESGYVILTRDGERKAGMMQLPFDGANPHWLPFVAVSDVRAAAEQVRQLGGEVIIDPDVVGRHDAAIVADPAGAVFGLQEWPRPPVAGGER